MGIYLRLRLWPDEIKAVEWERFYDEAKGVIQAFEPPAVRLTKEHKFGLTRRVFTRNTEGEDNKGRFLAVVGDAKTWGYAEQFRIYRDIWAYREMQRHRPAAAWTSGGVRHIVLRPGQGVDVFFAKTQSYPYHDLVWCIATLAEHDFPGLALAGGDLNARDWLPIHAWLRQVTGRLVSPPLLLDAQRLWNILGTEMEGLDLALAMSECMPDVTPLYQFLRDRDPNLLAQVLAETLHKHPVHSPGALHACLSYLDGVGDLAFLVKAACVDRAGPCWPVEEVLRMIVTLGAFEPEGRSPESGLAAGLFPAPFRCDFYRTNLYVRPEEAARQVADAIGCHVTDIEEIVFQLQRSREVPAVPEQDKGAKPVTKAQEESFTEDTAVGIPYPEALIRGLREAAANRGIAWDGAYLRRLVLIMIAEKGIALPEEAWATLDAETDPDLLGFLLFLLTADQDTTASRQVLCYIISNLPEIKQCWRSGQPWPLLVVTDC